MQTLNLKLVSGNTAPFRLTMYDPDGGRLPLTGYSFFFTIKRAWTDLEAAALLSKKITPAGDLANGVLEFELAAADTAIEPETAPFVWDIELVSGAGKVYTPFSGACTMLPRATRRTT